MGNLLGSTNKERVLIYLAARDRGYAREIARFFDVSPSPIQKAMDSLERAGVLNSRSIGKTREYEFNRRYPLREELSSLISKALSLYPASLRKELTTVRKRPRRRNKPL